MPDLCAGPVQWCLPAHLPSLHASIARGGVAGARLTPGSQIAWGRASPDTCASPPTGLSCGLHACPLRSRCVPRGDRCAGMGAAYGTAKSGVGIASMGVMRPELVMKSIVPVVMAGVLGIYGLIIAVIISTGGEPGLAAGAAGRRAQIAAHAAGVLVSGGCNRTAHTSETQAHLPAGPLVACCVSAVAVQHWTSPPPPPDGARSEPRQVHHVRWLCPPVLRPVVRPGWPGSRHGHRHRGRCGRAVGAVPMPSRRLVCVCVGRGARADGSGMRGPPGRRSGAAKPSSLPAGNL